MKIIPLGRMILVRVQSNGHPARTLTVIRDAPAVERFVVQACGPEVRDPLEPGQVVLANRLAGTVIGEELLLPESAILATL